MVGLIDGFAGPCSGWIRCMHGNRRAFPCRGASSGSVLSSKRSDIAMYLTCRLRASSRKKLVRRLDTAYTVSSRAPADRSAAGSAESQTTTSSGHCVKPRSRFKKRMVGRRPERSRGTHCSRSRNHGPRGRGHRWEKWTADLVGGGSILSSGERKHLYQRAILGIVAQKSAKS